MEDNFDELNNWLNDAKKQMENFKASSFSAMDGLPKEEQDKINKTLDSIDLSEIQKVANESTMNIINHIKNSIK